MTFSTARQADADRYGAFGLASSALVLAVVRAAGGAMPDAGGGTFAVTPDALTALAHGVGLIRDQLDATPDLVADLSGAVGSPEVAAALEHFVSGWRDGRRQITTEVGALCDMLRQAAQAYDDTESSIAAEMPRSAR